MICIEPLYNVPNADLYVKKPAIKLQALSRIIKRYNHNVVFALILFINKLAVMFIIKIKIIRTVAVPYAFLKDIPSDASV